MATIDGRVYGTHDLPRWPPASGPLLAWVQSAEDYRTAFDTWAQPGTATAVGISNWCGLSQGTFTLPVSGATRSGYAVWREAFAGCPLLGLDPSGRLEHWADIAPLTPTAVSAPFAERLARECPALPAAFRDGWAGSDEPWRMQAGQLFGRLIGGGQVGFVDLDSASVIDTVALQDRVRAAIDPLPQSFREVVDSTRTQRLAFINDFSVDLQVSLSGALLVKNAMAGFDERGYIPRAAGGYTAVFDGYVAAVSGLGSFAELAGDLPSVDDDIRPRVLDVGVGVWEPPARLLAKSNLGVTSSGEAVAVNDQGELIFVDPATGNAAGAVVLPLPGAGPEHYVAASVAQGLRLDGAVETPVTVVALSDAPNPSWPGASTRVRGGCPSTRIAAGMRSSPTSVCRPVSMRPTACVRLGSGTPRARMTQWISWPSPSRRIWTPTATRTTTAMGRPTSDWLRSSGLWRSWVARRRRTAAWRCASSCTTRCRT
jgi:hypothetical protein